MNELRKPPSGIPAHLRRSWLLLDRIASEESGADVLCDGENLGTWKDLNPGWQIHSGSILLRLHQPDRDLVFWISSAKTSSSGVTMTRAGQSWNLPRTIEVVWRESASGNRDALCSDIWHWIRASLPGSVMMSASRRTDLANTLTGAFLRIRFRLGPRDCLLLAAEKSRSVEDTHMALTHALLWLTYLNRVKALTAAPRIYIVVPRGHAAVLRHRAAYVNRRKSRVEVWEYEGSGESWQAHRAARPPNPVEGEDFRWPLLGESTSSPSLSRVLDLAPELIRRYPCFQDYDSLRLYGLEFARVSGAERDRVAYGVGPDRIDLNDDNFDGLCSLVREILYYRRPDSPDPRHLYYRLQAERWLESLMLEDVDRLFPELLPQAAYSQIPVYLGHTAGRVDILGVDRDGTLVVMELKVGPDPNLPVQCLDYWARVIAHCHNGDFERRGYFAGIRLNRRRPKIYLVAPVFSFHDSTERVMSYLDPGLEMWKISINEDWRCGVRILRRSRFRCGDLS